MTDVKAISLTSVTAGWCVVRVTGELDIATAPALGRCLRETVARHPAQGIVVDLRAVTFMDCAGLRPLLQCRREVSGRLCPTINVRRFPKKRLGAQDLVNFGTVPGLIMQFLESAVKARLNIVISGGTGSVVLPLPERPMSITVSC